MDKGTITKSTFEFFKFKLNGSLTQVTYATVWISSDDLRATLDPFGTSTTQFEKGTKYKAVVTGGTKDLAGNNLDQNRSLSGNQPKSWIVTVQR